MRALLVPFTVLLLVGSATAHEGQFVDLRKAPPDHQVEAVGYCGAKYEVKAGDRSFVVFSGPEEMKTFLKRTC